MIECSVLIPDSNLESWLIKTFDISKNQVKKSIDQKKKLLKSIKTRDVIKVPINISNHLRINPNYQSSEVKILFENKDFLALSKPEKVHCHPHTYTDQNNVLSFLRSIDHFETLYINKDSYDRSLLYRLDFETSGVLVLCKKEEDYFKIRKSFSELMKKKEYLAIVSNDFNQSGEHTQYFLPSLKKSSKQKVFDEMVEDSLEGKMYIEKLSYDQEKNLSLLKISLKTGLRHQIRAGLSHLNFPILGDDLYGDEKEDIPRLYLHAYRYELEYNDSLLIFEDKKPNLFSHLFNLNGFL